MVLELFSGIGGMHLATQRKFSHLSVNLIANLLEFTHFRKRDFGENSWGDGHKRERKFNIQSMHG